MAVVAVVPVEAVVPVDPVEAVVAVVNPVPVFTKSVQFEINKTYRVCKYP